MYCTAPCPIYSRYYSFLHCVELTISTPLSRETAFVEGDNVTLTVAVKSDDPPKMTWIVRGVELTTSDNNGTYVVGDRVEGTTDDRGLTEYSTTLNVLSINTTYEGEYHVEASTETDGLMVTTKGNVLQESEFFNLHLLLCLLSTHTCCPLQGWSHQCQLSMLTVLVYFLVPM